jgi:hypothetical protein
LSTCETRSGVEPDSVSSRTPVDLDLSGIGLEAGSGVLGGDSTLDSVPSLGDVGLDEAEGLKRGSGGDLDLCGDNVDAGDLFGNGVLDLDSRVDFDKVVAAHLVDQELDRSGVGVADLLANGERVFVESVEGVLGEMGSRSDLNDLIGTSQAEKSQFEHEKRTGKRKVSRTFWCRR